jgi:putative ABC transport system permease protein
VATATGVGSLFAGLSTEVPEPLRWIGGGAAATFLGVAVLAPLFARRLASVIGLPLRRLGLSGRLGRENAMRAPRRTASTASALMIGLGLVAFVAVFAASLRASFRAGLTDTLRADFILSTTQYQPFSPEVARLLAEDARLTDVAAFRIGEVKVAGSVTRVEGVNPATVEAVIDPEVTAGDITTLGADGIAVLRGTARERGLGIGDRVRVVFGRTGPQRFTVVAIFDQARAFNAPWAISLDAYDANFAEPLDTVVGVRAAAGVTGETPPPPPAPPSRPCSRTTRTCRSTTKPSTGRSRRGSSISSSVSSPRCSGSRSSSPSSAS